MYVCVGLGCYVCVRRRTRVLLMLLFVDDTVVFVDVDVLAIKYHMMPEILSPMSRDRPERELFNNIFVV